MHNIISRSEVTYVIDSRAELRLSLNHYEHWRAYVSGYAKRNHFRVGATQLASKVGLISSLSAQTVTIRFTDLQFPDKTINAKSFNKFLSADSGYITYGVAEDLHLIEQTQTAQ